MIKPKTQSDSLKPAIEKRDVNSLPRYTFTFDCFDRSHSLFNLGDDIGQQKAIHGEWFIDWLDAMREISQMPIPSLKGGKFDLHPVDWEHANPQKPADADQREYLQLRVNKSRGRIIGFASSGSVFHIVWLDPHHNLSNSEGYGKAVYYRSPKSEYEILLDRITNAESRIAELESDIDKLLFE